MLLRVSDGSGCETALSVVPKRDDFWGHFSLVYQLLQDTSLIPTLFLIHSRCSISNYWKQGVAEGGYREGREEREVGHKDRRQERKNAKWGCRTCKRRKGRSFYQNLRKSVN